MFSPMRQQGIVSARVSQPTVRKCQIDENRRRQIGEKPGASPGQRRAVCQEV
jgi:hypothetical protein